MQSPQELEAQRLSQSRHPTNGPLMRLVSPPHPLMFDPLLDLSEEESQPISRQLDEAHRLAGPASGGWRWWLRER